jgi:hypothetical protein
MKCPHWRRKSRSPCTPVSVGSPFLFLAHLPHSRESLVSGRRVTGREAIACDAVGVLDAVAATGTLVRRGRRHTPSTCSAADKPARSSDHARDARRAVPGRPPRAAARCERGRARRSAAEPPCLKNGTTRPRDVDLVGTPGLSGVWRHLPGGFIRESGKSQMATISTFTCSFLVVARRKAHHHHLRRCRASGPACATGRAAKPRRMPQKSQTKSQRSPTPGDVHRQPETISAGRRIVRRH